MIYGVLIVIFNVFISSCSQILLKVSANEKHSNFHSSLLNWKVAIAYMIFSLSLLLNLMVMKMGLDLKWFPILESLGYVFVYILSLLFLKETLNGKWLGMTLIIIGVCIFNI